ncbi:hypothetical protein PYCC9005_004540 [Savitreella phatthalungensis]
MSHMNKDHAHNMRDYLMYYCGVDRGMIGCAQMVELDDAGMTIVADGAEARSTRYHVPFTPPLHNLEGIRPRVIEMAHTAAKALRPNDPLPGGAH